MAAAGMRSGADKAAAKPAATPPRRPLLSPLTDRWLSLWWAGSLAPYTHVLDAKRVTLRAPRVSDFEEWAAVREASRSHLQPWEPTWFDADMTPSGYARRIRLEYIDIKLDLTRPYYIFRKDTGALVGGINLRNIRRGVAQAATIGYWMSEANAGQGLMGEALRRLIAHAFTTQKLRRLEAGILPENTPSRRLLTRAGFTPEGVAKDWLRINGKWRDHQMFALLNK